MRLKNKFFFLIIFSLFYLAINLTTIKTDADSLLTSSSSPGSVKKKTKPHGNATIVSVSDPYSSSFQESTSALGFHVYNHGNIDKISIVGERHSGTTFLTRYLKACFPSHSVNDHFVVGKHWFQPDPQYVVKATKRYGKDGLSPTAIMDDDFAKSWWEIGNSKDIPARNQFNDTLVVAIFRNPYDWIEGMRRKPHHWPNHVDLMPREKSTLAELNYTRQKEIGKRRTRSRRLKIIQKSFVKADILDWYEFVTKPMYLVSHPETDTGDLCQKGFEFGTVSPCEAFYTPPQLKHIPRSFLKNLPYEADEAVYEFFNPIDNNNNKKSRPFHNPLELRTAKITNVLGLPKNWNLGAFGVIQYENILGSNITTHLVSEIEAILKTTSKCPKLETFHKKPYDMPSKFRKWITDHSDWEIESRIHYFPQQDG